MGLGLTWTNATITFSYVGGDSVRAGRAGQGRVGRQTRLLLKKALSNPDAEGAMLV